MPYSVHYKRAWLGKIYRAGIAASKTLIEALEAESDARIAQTQSGRVISQVQSNGTMVGFSQPSQRTSTETDAAELAGEMLYLYADAVDGLATDATPNLTPTDEQIYARMVQGLYPVTEFSNDWSSAT